jgi:hypothetical protein
MLGCLQHGTAAAWWVVVDTSIVNLCSSLLGLSYGPVAECNACNLAACYRVSGMHADHWASRWTRRQCETPCASGRPTTPSRSRRDAVEADRWAIRHSTLQSPRE